jgi:GR25 family glycosyltransferase involved in LPS biosynthesis
MIKTDFLNKYTKYVIFRSSGRLGNAIFRYLASILFCIKYNFEFILEENFKENFIFYKGVDSPGNDIGFINDSNIELLKDKCDKNNLSGGFNTLGFIKSTINIDLLQSNEFINNFNDHGLYLKNYIYVNDNNFFDFYYNTSDLNQNIIMDGFFQFDNIYTDNKNKILEYINKYNHTIKTDDNQYFLISDLFNELNESKKYDVSIHIRIADFKDREDFIEYKYLEELFNNNFHKYIDKKIALVCSVPNDDYNNIYINNCLEWFNNKNFNITLESNNTIEDFLIMKNSKILICSNSTLSWSAAYLSDEIDICYMPNYSFYQIDNRITYFKYPIMNTVLYKVNEISSLKLKVIILTLENYTDRTNNIKLLISIFKQIGIEVEIFYGVDGNDIKIYNTEIDHIKLLYYKFQTFYYNSTIRLNKLPMKLGEFGCSWSHLNIYNKLLNDNNFDKYLILEDDAKLNSTLNYLVQHLLNIPDNFDICHLGESTYYPFHKNNKINDLFYNIHKKSFNNLTSYIISKNGSYKIIQYTNNYINIPADDILSIMNYFSIYNFNVCVPDKYIFHQYNCKSIINSIN